MTRTPTKQNPSFIQQVLNPSTNSYSLEIMSFGQANMDVHKIRNRYSRYSYDGHRTNKNILQRVNRKESIKSTDSVGQFEIQSETFVSLKVTTRSLVNFKTFERIEKEVLPVKETKASMGRKKRISQNKIKNSKIRSSM